MLGGLAEREVEGDCGIVKFEGASSLTEDGDPPRSGAQPPDVRRPKSYPRAVYHAVNSQPACKCRLRLPIHRQFNTAWCAGKGLPPAHGRSCPTWTSVILPFDRSLEQRGPWAGCVQQAGFMSTCAWSGFVSMNSKPNSAFTCRIFELKNRIPLFLKMLQAPRRKRLNRCGRPASRARRRRVRGTRA